MAATAYPPPGSTDAEVFYNRLDPFFWSWVAGLGAVAALAISLRSGGGRCSRLGMAFLAATQALILTGLALRAYITGWTPVTNMFETIVFVALCVGLLGMGFALLLRWRDAARPGSAAPPEQSYAPTTVALAAASLASLALVLAYYVPAFPKDIRPLAPVLRSNLWLAVHVLSIVAGYGAAMLAFGLGYVASLCYLFGRYRDGREPEACVFLAALTYRMLQIAVLLLLAGTALGALWADVSWGRFWGWDPKEVWALISLLVYLAFLHGRSIGWSGNFGTVFAPCSASPSSCGPGTAIFVRGQALLRRGRGRAVGSADDPGAGRPGFELGVVDCGRRAVSFHHPARRRRRSGNPVPDISSSTRPFQARGRLTLSGT